MFSEERAERLLRHNGEGCLQDRVHFGGGMGAHITHDPVNGADSLHRALPPTRNRHVPHHAGASGHPRAPVSAFAWLQVCAQAMVS